MKRILCIVSAMNAGGAETFLMKLYRKIDKTKYQMDFCVTVNERGVYDDEIESMGGKIFRITKKSENIKKFKSELYNVIKENEYKYVLRITSSAMGFMDLKVAKSAGAEVLAARSSNSSDGGSIKSSIAHILGRILYGRYVDVKIAPSDLAAEYTFGKRAYKNGKVAILNNAVDLDVFHFDEKGRRNIRNEFNISPHTKVIGHIGRFSAQKNHEFLIDVFKDITLLNPDTILLLVGVGESEKKVKQKVSYMGLSDKVIFAGLRTDIPQILCAMDVFLFPSFYEGMPNTVIEAQATALPCVISDRITKQANILGTAKYLPLESSVSVWAKETLNSAECKRYNTRENFIKSGYEINKVTEKFLKLIFNEREG